MATKPVKKAAILTSKPAAKKPAVKKVVAKEEEQKYDMPKQVLDWIERASSIMKNQKGQIEDLKRENAELKSYRAWAEKRILQMDIADRENN
jgi:hypothetical protein